MGGKYRYESSCSKNAPGNLRLPGAFFEQLDLGWMLCVFWPHCYELSEVFKVDLLPSIDALFSVLQSLSDIETITL